MGHSKKHKKKEKKHKKEKKRKRDTSSSSSESEEEWVEKTPASQEGDMRGKAEEQKRDDWMNMDFGVATFSNDARKKRKEKEEQEAKEKSLLNQPGQSSRELNPYWREGGTGLPSENKSLSGHLTKTVGDHGIKWLRKAFQRAKEEAVEKGVSLESVVAERWGSLDHLKQLLDEAELKEARRNKFGHREYKDFKREDRYKRDRSRDRDKHRPSFRSPVDGNETKQRFKMPHDPDGERDDRRHRRDDSADGKSDDRRSRKHFGQESKSRFRIPKDSDEDFVRSRRDLDEEKDRKEHSQYKSSHGNFDDTRNRQPEGYRQSYSSNSSRKGWRKPSENKNTEDSSKDRRATPERERQTPINEPSQDEPEDKILSKDELNKLGARMIKAEIMGDTALAAKLKQQLENARAASESNNSRSKQIVTLTETDSRGFTRPFTAPTEAGRSKKRRVATHENKQRVRYFADDDKHSLQDMFENERFNTVADQNATFARLMGREMSRKDGSLALDDPFEETAATDNSAKDNSRKISQTIQNQIKKEKAFDECRWCIMGLNAQQDIIVTTRSKVHLCVPPFQSLTTNHCLIVPNFHVSCGTQVDEDVWDDIMEMRKILVKLFEKDDNDVIFFEHAINFHKHPHMLLHCVPVPKEIGDVAPIYFKKAMLECETEWSNNKKVVELAGRDVRKAVPKGLPYFAVDFGMQSGYAHVIEDYKLFPRNFAQEIIGGMLDLDHGIWRKQKHESTETVKIKRDELRKLIENV